MTIPAIGTKIDGMATPASVAKVTAFLEKRSTPLIKKRTENKILPNNKIYFMDTTFLMHDLYIMELYYTYKINSRIFLTKVCSDKIVTNFLGEGFHELFLFK
jgi:hypothetical protein